jgi:hypothetical protein
VLRVEADIPAQRRKRDVWHCSTPRVVVFVVVVALSMASAALVSSGPSDVLSC